VTKTQHRKRLVNALRLISDDAEAAIEALRREDTDEVTDLISDLIFNSNKADDYLTAYITATK
jgi:hypothetical protein